VRVVQLTKGDTVRDSSGVQGTVVGFTVDGVRIEWPDSTFVYGDDELRLGGIERAK
jgi:preprotein translocase subunit YajC